MKKAVLLTKVGKTAIFYQNMLLFGYINAENFSKQSAQSLR